jgi:hypothetical protein
MICYRGMLAKRLGRWCFFFGGRLFAKLGCNARLREAVALFNLCG